MVNEEIISPLPLLYLYLFFIILIIIDTTSIYPSLTLKLLYLFNLLVLSFLLLYENPCIILQSHLIYLPSTLHSLIFSFVQLFPVLFYFYFFILLFRGFLNFFCTAILRRISGLAVASFW